MWMQLSLTFCFRGLSASPRMGFTLANTFYIWLWLLRLGFVSPLNLQNLFLLYQNIPLAPHNMHFFLLLHRRSKTWPDALGARCCHWPHFTCGLVIWVSNIQNLWLPKMTLNSLRRAFSWTRMQVESAGRQCCFLPVCLELFGLSFNCLFLATIWLHTSPRTPIFLARRLKMIIQKRSHFWEIFSTRLLTICSKGFFPFCGFFLIQILPLKDAWGGCQICETAKERPRKVSIILAFLF